jgi:hypothetical protein
VLAVASFIVVRRSLRRLEQRAEDAFPGEHVGPFTMARERFPIENRSVSGM